MKRFLILFAVLSFLFSCANPQEGRKEVCVALSGVRLEICGDAPLFELIYANDTIVIASLLSNKSLLGMYRIGDPETFHKFLNVGRGPMEVTYASAISRSDTLHVLSYGPYGICGIIRIPVESAVDMQSWEYTDYSEYCGFLVGRGFCIKSYDEYVMLGEKYGQENIMSVLSSNTPHIAPMHFWPDDGFDGPAIVKQGVYGPGAKIFCNGDKILYAGDWGRYVSILNLSGSAISSETKIYDEYPIYTAAGDGINPTRSRESNLGVQAYTTDSRIYISTLEYHLVNGEYVPDNYKGYPPYFIDRIEVYDWAGQYVKTYSLDVPFGTFYVSEDDSCIYTVSENLETMFPEVYRYELN